MLTFTALAITTALKLGGPVLCTGTLGADGDLTVKMLNLTREPVAVVNHPSSFKVRLMPRPRDFDGIIEATQKDLVALPPGKTVTFRSARRYTLKDVIGMDYSGMTAEVLREIYRSLDANRPIERPRCMVDGREMSLMLSATVHLRILGPKRP